MACPSRSDDIGTTGTSLTTEAILRPPPSKADSLGIFWGNDPVYLPWEATEPICAARWLALLERRRRIPPERRRAVPLLCDGQGLPFRHGPLDAVLRAMLLAVGVPYSEASKYSWHSFRVYLATALLARKDASGRSTPIETIQCMLRWKTADALKIYARMDAAEYAGLLSEAVRTGFETMRTAYFQQAQQVAFAADNVAINVDRHVDRLYADARACDDGCDEDPGDAEF